MSTDFDALPPGPWDVIYADPPWAYEALTAVNSQAADHYQTLPVSELAALPVPEVAAPDCLLWMWTTGPKLDQALELGAAWGFQYRTVGFVWVKDRANAGNYTLSETEQCLVFKRGRIPDRGARNIRQLLHAPTGLHSRKPIEARHRLDAMYPTSRRLELFARLDAPGWTVWGNEAPGAAQLPQQTLTWQEHTT